MKRNMYIAFTPYHIFLASMIALEYRDDHNSLLVIADFDAAQMIEALRQSDLFTDCDVLPGLYKLKKRRNSLRRNNAKKIYEFLCKGIELDRLFLGTDTRVETQAAAYAAKQAKQDTRISVLEDGGDFYNSVDADYKPKNFWHKLYGKIIFGTWYEDVKIAGLYTLTEDIRAIFPEHLRAELTEMQKSLVCGQYCYEIRFQNFLREYWKKFSLEKEYFTQIDGILMIAYSGSTKQIPGYRKMLRKICENAAKEKLKIAVKYHPREETDDHCGLASLPNVIFLPAQAPAEMIYAYVPQSLKFIVGDISSSLMTAKWILKNHVEVYSTANILQINDTCLLNIFAQIGIHILKEDELVGFE